MRILTTSSVFRRIAEKAIRKEWPRLSQQVEQLPISTEVHDSSGEYSVVLQIIELLKRDISVFAIVDRVQVTAARREETGIHLMIEMQKLKPPGAEGMDSTTVFLWDNDLEPPGIEWSLSEVDD